MSELEEEFNGDRYDDVLERVRTDIELYGGWLGRSLIDGPKAQRRARTLFRFAVGLDFASVCGFVAGYELESVDTSYGSAVLAAGAVGAIVASIRQRRIADALERNRDGDRETLLAARAAQKLNDGVTSAVVADELLASIPLRLHESYLVRLPIPPTEQAT